MHHDEVLKLFRLFVLGAVVDWNHWARQLDDDGVHRYADDIITAVWPCLYQRRDLYGAHSDLTCQVWFAARRLFLPLLANPQT